MIDLGKISAGSMALRMAINPYALPKLPIGHCKKVVWPQGVRFNIHHFGLRGPDIDLGNILAGLEGPMYGHPPIRPPKSKH